MILSEVQRLESVILDFDARVRDEGYGGLEPGPEGQGQRRGSMIEGAGLAGGVCGRLTKLLLGKVEELRGEIGGDR